MQIPSLTPLTAAHAQIIEAVSERLGKRAASAFRRVGPKVCRAHVESAMTALVQDLAANQREGVRAFVHALVLELAPNGLTFADLRFFAQTFRAQVRETSSATPEATELRLGVEDWFFELIVVCTTCFMAWRDEKIQREAAQLGVQRLESQLAELEVALEEKTQLLELIRQASTPIAPVVQGILVVPLIGTFDTLRAEMLTEKLLLEIARLHTRAAILDISGVPVFDTAAAQLIIRLARTIRLLGTAAILVGMSPQNARTIVQLGVDLTGIPTLATLQDGLARALKLQRLKITPLPTS
ncbi:RsbR, positive regulator of sigma-B [Enhygromyxa salina]|uniref:RsbR, positive regulator of sigma-B n=1 Tax=Enhygromyxa salina TaxID=215803 RepID=A0A0C2A717_9BACT|nr:STAS domain-containing protein [Enhygromyxa salina]KIG19188.1 RsbR, positive regulator of sigma-B [Enhygromyxa salina]